MILSEIVSLLQNAFALNREIDDNILIAHQILNLFFKRPPKEGCMAIKLGMEKSYGRLHSHS